MSHAHTPPAESSTGLIDLDLGRFRKAFGFGVAGNFAGHLEQAGEAADFEHVAAPAHEAPKGIFPWFIGPAADAPSPGTPAFLATFPLSNDRLARPEIGADANLQIEPEVGLVATVSYDESGAVTGLAPRGIAAFNDCSIRRPSALKISHKKNWGSDSKGVAPRAFAVSDLSPDGLTASFRLACFLRRDGVAHAYGLDSPVPNYSYYGAQLLDWIVERLQGQTGEPGTPLENVGDYLHAAGQPDHVLIGIGATRYTEFGEFNFLQAGDDSIVIVYDAAVHSPEQIEAAVGAGSELELSAASVLTQTVYASDAPLPVTD